MNAITVKDAKRNLEQLIEQVAADLEPTIMIGAKGDRIVLVPLEEFNAWPVSYTHLDVYKRQIVYFCGTARRRARRGVRHQVKMTDDLSRRSVRQRLWQAT